MRAPIFATAFSLAMALALPGLAGRAHRENNPEIAAAGKPAPPEAPIPLRIRIAPPFRESGADTPLRLQSGDGANGGPADIPAVRIGPLQAQLGGTDGKPRIARYRLEGVKVLGGSVSGSVDGRGATIFLRWPPGDDDK